ncbi:glycosyl hydrolase family 18 protein [soil metagenome]
MIALLAAVAMMPAVSPPVIAGYLPSWKLGGYALSRLNPLTDVMLFSATLTGEGRLDTSDLSESALASLKTARKKQGFKLILCVGGWGRSDGFVATAASAAFRQQFCKDATAFCDKYSFDGIDLDWEHPANDAQAADYGTLIKALHDELAPKNRLVTAAVAGWQTMTPRAVKNLDRVNLMAYDHEGKHATLEDSKADVDKLKALGFAESRIVLGVPFYGRKLSKPDDAMAYSDIFAQFHPTANVDEIGGYYFNGPKMMKNKAAYAKTNGLAGVMIWEVTQDATGSASLLDALKRAMAP